MENFSQVLHWSLKEKMGNNYDNIILVIQFKIIIDFLVGSGTYRKKIKV